MKNLSIYTLVFAFALISIQGCGPSEEERRAAEQARLDSLRQVEQQRIEQLMQAREDSLARVAEQQAMEEEEEEEKSGNFAENGNYAVQVGAFRSETQANSYRDKLRERNYPNVYTVKVGDEKTGDIWFRLRVGFFANEADAEAFGAKLGQELNTGYWVSKVERQSN
ncbi:SPOR domain-containing protein [Gracilimonas sp. Q87]|uniref:SPOR domain-containing protein n=1 Tax=Gracilimonas sp. Q87 TaxID=3384766 RepID=UPI0039841B61